MWLLGVQVKSQSSPVKSYAIQFTGEDANIYKIEKIAKINYKAFKIHRFRFIKYNPIIKPYKVMYMATDNRASSICVVFNI
jgi:hypothetical protein